MEIHPGAWLIEYWNVKNRNGPLRLIKWYYMP
jgi:hypothetical protein